MKVWIVNPYGELPSEGWREYRSFLVARALAAHGHEVTWWISDFEHRNKQYRKEGRLADSMLPEGVRVIAVHSTPYKRNISLQRIQYELNYGKELARLAENEPRPDLIILGFPAIFTGNPVIAYRNKIGCKLVLDVIDIWPELFEVILPKKIRFLGKLIFYPLYRLRNKQTNFSDGIIAVSQDYLKTALKGQSKRIPSLISYLGIDLSSYHSAEINPVLNQTLEKFRKDFNLVVVYAGTLGDAYDMDIIISAIKRVKQEGLSIGFVVAGNGPRKTDFQDMAGDASLPLKYLGLLPAKDMKTLYENCDVGLMTYVTGSTVAMPVKFFDYTAGGLALLSSLDRDAGETIRQYGIGLNYQASNLGDFIQKLAVMSQDFDLVQGYKRNARQLAWSYDTKVQYDNYATFLEEIVHARSSQDDSIDSFAPPPGCRSNRLNRDNVETPQPFSNIHILHPITPDMSHEVSYRFAKEADARHLAELHVICGKKQTGSFMPMLGTRFLTAYYKVLLAAESSVVLLAYRSATNEFLGFHSGAIDAKSAQAAISSAKYYLGFIALTSLLFKPKTLLDVIKRHRALNNKSSDFIIRNGPRGEYWAWKPDALPVHGAIEIHKLWHHIMRTLGCEYVRSEVNVDHARVRKVVLAMGGKVISETIDLNNQARIIVEYNLAEYCSKFPLVPGR